MKTKDLNLCEILKDCPKGMELYSPIYGIMRLHSVRKESDDYPISMADSDNCLHTFHSDGKIYLNAQAECCLFPSKDNRDWSTFKPKKERFDPKTLKPFDKVLVRDDDDRSWVAIVFSHIEMWEQQIPYNSDTAHLVGTTDEAPEYYKWWE